MKPDSLSLANCNKLFPGGGWLEKGYAMKLYLMGYETFYLFSSVFVGRNAINITISVWKKVIQLWHLFVH